MEDNTGTPKKRKYPARARKPVTYKDFDLSMEIVERKRSKKNLDESTSSKDEMEIEEYDESEEQEMSDYEKMIVKQQEENRRMMMQLGLLNPNIEVKKVEKHKTKPKKMVKAPIIPQQPLKRSLRLQKKTPDGKNVHLDLFQETPEESPKLSNEKARIEEEILPMNDDGESTDFLNALKTSLSQESSKSSIDLVDNLMNDMRDLQLAAVARANSTRVQGMCIHPMESKLFVISGSKNGQLGLWNATEGEVVQFYPHVANINCVTVDKTDGSNIFSTSHDGTVRCADLNKTTFNLVYETTEKNDFCHLTWHAQIDQNTLLVAHGTGETAIVDLRAHEAQRWYKCHPRSVRTVQLHPTQSQYFLTSSGSGECKIWDLRCNKKYTDEYVAELSRPSKGKGMTSAFFSPDGSRVVMTCNDDYLRFYDTSNLAMPRETNKVMHDNHTGRWLSVFKAVWYPQSSDIVFVGSKLDPRRIQLYSGTGKLMRELKDPELTTICSVIAPHPSLPVLVGGNSSGKAHLFTTPTLTDLVKKEDDEC